MNTRHFPSPRCLAPLMAAALLAAGAAHAQSAAQWTKAAPAGLARQELYPEVLNGKIYVAGGLRVGGNAATDVHEVLVLGRD